MARKRTLDDGAAAACREEPRRAFTSIRAYQVLEKIGEGTYGVVFRASHRHTGETVALKGLRADEDGQKPDLGEFWREADFLTLCRGHPSIVDLRDVARDVATGDVFLVMEYVGPSLHHVIAEERLGRPFSEAETRRLMRQLLSGALKMHSNGVMHRDLKPGNVLVNNDGDLKICDFGMAKCILEPPPCGEPVGTLRYNAPELLMGKVDYDESVDTWALGCIMAELLAGEPLFRGESEEEVLSQVFDMVSPPEKKTWPCVVPRRKRAGRPRNGLHELFPAVAGSSRRPALSHAGFDVLSGLLACNPKERMSAAAALRHPWLAAPDVPTATASTLPKLSFLWRADSVVPAIVV